MSRLDDWVAEVERALELPGGLDRDLVLDIARDVAHGVARPAAPLTTFLVGLAAGRAGGDPAAVAQAAREVTDLAGQWAARGGDPADGEPAHRDGDARGGEPADGEPAHGGRGERADAPTDTPAQAP
jgi:hypothetical protein